jgi:hypothetical protein
MGIAWAVSERPKYLVMNIKRGNGVKKEILAEKRMMALPDTRIKFS